MPRQRDTGRRWPFGWPARRRQAIGTVPLLDTISLTGFMTDPSEPELPPASRTGSDVLGELPDWQGERAIALPATTARPDPPEVGPRRATPRRDPVGTESRGEEPVGGDSPSGGPVAAEPPDATDLLDVLEMPVGFAWGSALDLLGALDAAAEPSPPAGPGAVELLDAIVGPVGHAAAEGSGEDADGLPADDAGPAFLPVPGPSPVVVPDEVIAGPRSSDPERDDEPGQWSQRSDPPGVFGGVGRGRSVARVSRRRRVGSGPAGPAAPLSPRGSVSFSSPADVSSPVA